MAASQSDDPTDFYVLNKKMFSFKNIVASEGGESGECIATATAKVEIWFARTYCRDVMPLGLCRWVVSAGKRI
jgi:hypothetical protein